MSKPSILFLDIETAPDVVWTWGVYQANAIAVKEHWYVLSFAAKWKGEGRIIVKGLCDYADYEAGNDNEDDLLLEVWDLLDAADIVVAHNGKDFDIKKLNARFIANNMNPPSPFKVIDTKSDLKSVANFSSNRLNWLSKQLELGSKTQEHQDFSMWEGCMMGDETAWLKMLRYNRHDVVLLEKLYNELQPWIRQPNWTAYGSGDGCPACGKNTLVKRGTQVNKTMSYQRYQCSNCGKWARSTSGQRVARIVGI